MAAVTSCENRELANFVCPAAAVHYIKVNCVSIDWLQTTYMIKNCNSETIAGLVNQCRCTGESGRFASMRAEIIFSTRRIYQSRTQSPRASWSAG